jgi:hypothetical protein
VSQTGIGELGFRVDGIPIQARKYGSGGGPVEAPIVEEHMYPHTLDRRAAAALWFGFEAKERACSARLEALNV